MTKEFTKLIHSQCHYLANPFQLPEARRELRTTATSGRTLLSLLSKRDPLTYLSKMLLASPIWFSSARKLTWKVKATPCGHLLFQLAPSMRTTGVIGSGSWPKDLLPTLSAVEYGYNQGGGAGRVGKKRYLIQVLAKKGLLPTLCARDSADKPMPPRRKNPSGGQKPPLLSVVGGKLNPEWCEIYLGFPQGHTETIKNRKERVKMMGNAIYLDVATVIGAAVMQDFKRDIK